MAPPARKKQKVNGIGRPVSGKEYGFLFHPHYINS
jgi:hypothetical protein